MYEFNVCGIILSAAVIVIWAVFLVVQKIMRRAGVVSYPPFKNRQEYLLAALEMNLEDFIGRAKATPRSVIEKPIQPAGIIAACPTNPLRSGEPHQMFILALMPGVWKRTKDGRLVEIVRNWDGVVTCNVASGGVESFPAEHLEPAVPKAGEWWRWASAELQNGDRLALDSRAPFRWTPRPSESLGYDPRAEVEAKNLLPVNYGKGLAVSGSLEKYGVVGFRIGQWVRLKLYHDRLAQISDFREGDVGCSYWKDGDPTIYMSPKTIEAAYPKTDEWWIKLVCVKTHLPSGMAFVQGKRQWASDDPQAAEAVRCGCLMPVNFGEGEQKSGVA